MSDHRLGMCGPSGGPGSIERPRKPRKGFGVKVQRQGCVVNLSLIAEDEYGAVELYEHFVRSLQQGKLSLDIG